MDRNQNETPKLMTPEIIGVLPNIVETQKPENTHHEIDYNLAHNEKGYSPKDGGNTINYASSRENESRNTFNNASPDDNESSNIN